MWRTEEGTRGQALRAGWSEFGRECGDRRCATVFVGLLARGGRVEGRGDRRCAGRTGLRDFMISWIKGARHPVEVWWWFDSNVRCASDKVPGTLWLRCIRKVRRGAESGVENAMGAAEWALFMVGLASPLRLLLSADLSLQIRGQSLQSVGSGGCSKRSLGGG
jgi:hypothetical protein